MTEVWLIVEAGFPDLQALEIVREFVRPIVDEFDDALVTFHYFFERKFLPRLKAGQNAITNRMKPYVDQKLSELKAVEPAVRVDAGYT